MFRVINQGVVAKFRFQNINISLASLEEKCTVLALLPPFHPFELSITRTVFDLFVKLRVIGSLLYMYVTSESLETRKSFN